MVTPCSILSLRTRRPKFNPKEPRVSEIGYCARRQAAEKLGLVERQFPEFYEVAGHALQSYYAGWYRDLCEEVYEEVEVPTSIGTTCHLDIVVRDPRFGTLGIEVKSVEEKWLDSSSRAKTPAILQSTLCWKYTLDNGGGVAQDGRIVDFVPERWYVLCLGRQTYGLQRRDFEVKYSVNVAEQLVERYEETASCIDMRVLPPGLTSPNWECRSLESVCPLEAYCWT